MSNDVVLLSEENKSLDETLAKLKTYAIELKQAGYEYYDFDGQKLSPELRQKALQLHYFSTFLMVSSNGENVDTPFNANNARRLVAAGDSYDEFVTKIKKFDIPVKCNVIWDELAVAYRCYTCGLNACMSLCSTCFEAGNHRGHDYNRFFSSSGGKCDCGDEDVVLESGFCNNHGKKNNPPMDIPIDLTVMIEFMMQKILMKLAEKFRGYSRRERLITDDDNYALHCHAEIISQRIMRDADPLIIFLDDLISLSAPCVDIMAKILCDNDFYTKIKEYHNIKEMSEDSVITIEEMDLVNSRNNELIDDIKTLKHYSVPNNLAGVVEFLPRYSLDCNCLLDELMFYQIREGFPQTLINFLLKLLPNNEYKNRFASIFFGHYDQIETLLLQVSREHAKPVDTHIPNKIISRVVHISVQICSSKNMCLMLQSEVNILRRVLESCLRIIFNNATPLNLAQDDSVQSKWFALDVEKNTLFENYGYSGAATDLQNLFAHFDLLALVFNDPYVAKEFGLLISAIEGMNPLRRISRGNHVERDIAYAGRSYTFEMEVSTTFINQTLSSNFSYPEHTLYGDFLIEKLKEFFDFVFSNEVLKILSSNYVTFHIPLHRELALVCMKYFVENKKLTLPNDPNFLKALIAHPLRLQAVCSEFFAGMWTRNGTAIHNAVVYYFQPTFRNLVDNDIALIRLVATMLPPFEITGLMYETFHMKDCFTYCCFDFDANTAPQNSIIFDKKWIPFMVDGYFKLLFELIFIRSLAELTLEEELRLQIVHVLTSNEKALYSKIRQYFQYIPQIDELMFERILNEVSTFVRPDGVGKTNQQGHYVLKPELWINTVDLIQSKYRSMGTKEFNTIALNQEKILTKHIGERRPWLHYWLNDFKDNDLIFTKSLHILVQPSNIYICRFILEWYLHGDFAIHIVQQAVFLLNLIIKITTLPVVDEIEIEFINHNEEEDGKETYTAPFQRAKYFQYFNQKPTQKIYLEAKEPESLLSLIIKLYYHLFGSDYPKKTKTEAAQAIENVCKTELSTLDQIIGSGTDYVGRLIAWLYNCDPVSKQIIQEQVFSLTSHAQQSASSESQKLMEKKIAAKRRQLELINMQRAKQSALMKKFADEEGMDYEPSNESNHIICSICNDSCNEDEQNLFGVLVYFQTGSVVEDSVTAKTSSFALGETPMEVETDSVEGSLMATYRDFETEAVSSFQKVHPSPSNLFSFLPYVELKTCAHHAHLSCIQTYKQSFMANDFHSHSLNALPCPLCRSHVSYALPLAPKLEIDSVEIDFDNFFSDQTHIKTIIDHHREFETSATPLLSSDSTGCYEKLKKKIKKLVTLREVVSASESSVPLLVQQVVEYNPQIFPLSLIKNYVDRITEIEDNNYEFPSRLKGNIADHLFFMACIDSSKLDDCEQFFVKIWKQIYGDRNGIPLFHYDSQTILITCATALTVLNLPKQTRLEFYRLCVKIALIHCFLRTSIISLFNRPTEKRKQIVENLPTLQSNGSNLQNIYQKTVEYFMCGNLIDRGSVWVNGFLDASAKAINDKVQNQLIKFLKFATTLAVELQLASSSTKPNELSFDIQFDHYSEILFGQTVQLSNILDYIGDSRVKKWIGNFLETPDQMASCYIDNAWQMKMLRKLPESFDSLFKSYFNKKCIKCQTVPNQPIICLICGQLLCYDTCCEVELHLDVPNKISEIEIHANSCSSGSVCFLSISSTTVIVYHHRHVNLFQSPYLDKHFEEDRNLRRGKSLFLSKDRYERLQELWIKHDFERGMNTTNIWFPIESLGDLLRQAHNLY